MDGGERSSYGQDMRFAPQTTAPGSSGAVSLH
jgi:hypothetical protein